MSKNTFGRRLLQARLDLAARLGKPVSQTDVAAMMGVSSVSVSRWESDAKEPDLATIRRLAAALGTTPGYLAFGVVPVAPDDRARKQRARVGDLEHITEGLEDAASDGSKIPAG